MRPAGSTEIGKRLGEMIDAAQKAVDEVRQRAEEVAVADREYKRGYAQAMVKSDLKTVRERECYADEATASQRYDLKLAEGLMDAAKLNSRARIAAISALQTWAGAWKVEFEAEHRGPRMTP